MHIHGIFPYLYVPKPENAGDGFVYQLAGSIDRALNISFMNNSSDANKKSSLHHVYKVVEVAGKPFYGKALFL